MTREQAVREVAEAIVAVERPHPVRVAVDGVGASGKTVFADALAEEVRRGGRDVVRVSIDGFHNPAATRTRQGADSPRGYYEDSFDYGAFTSHVLEPLGPGGSRSIRRAVFDFRTDSPVDSPVEDVAPDAVLIVDGIFLLRPELLAGWDYRVFVEVDFDVALARALTRDLVLFGSAEAVEERYRARYIPGEKHYLDTVGPATLADVVIENNDFLNPGVRWCSNGRREETA